MITIIYANRNRDLQRIKTSLDSLAAQNSQNFKVVFVDYGSKKDLLEGLKDLIQRYDFARFFHLSVSQLLWNKSKALNFGINQVNTPLTFIADTDLIFHPETTSHFERLKLQKNFFLFKLGYLDRKASGNLGNQNFIELKPSRFGDVNGMILASAKALREVNGLDEFFHFYGAEDEDLFARLENAGFKRELDNSKYFYHNWHQSFSGSEDELLTGNPRVKNIMRINQRHFFRNREKGILKPLQQERMGEIISKEESELLKRPDKTIRISNIQAHVEHFLGEELPSYKGKIIKVEFFEDPYFRSLKYKLKKRLGKQTQPFISMKEVNDSLLKEILFRYRNYNYSFMVEEDLKSITFCIKL